MFRSILFISTQSSSYEFLLISTTSLRPTDSVSSPVWPWNLILSSLARWHLEKQTLHIISWKKRNNTAYLTNMLWLAYSLRTQNSNFLSTQFTSMAQFFCKDHFAYQVLVFRTKKKNPRGKRTQILSLLVFLHLEIRYSGEQDFKTRLLP